MGELILRCLAGLVVLYLIGFFAAMLILSRRQPPAWLAMPASLERRQAWASWQTARDRWRYRWRWPLAIALGPAHLAISTVRGAWDGFTEAVVDLRETVARQVLTPHVHPLDDPRRASRAGKGEPSDA